MMSQDTNQTHRSFFEIKKHHIISLIVTAVLFACGQTVPPEKEDGNKNGKR